LEHDCRLVKVQINAVGVVHCQHIHILPQLFASGRRLPEKRLGLTPCRYSQTFKLSQEHQTRCSPRTHWRRGHWRSQRIGANQSQIKSSWIEPTLING
jgi:hypothetical protein